MTKWTKLGIGFAALVLAVAAGTAAYATWGGSGNDTEQAGQRQADQESDGGGQTMGMCAPGYEDCNDMAVDPAGGTCLEGTTDCIDTPGISNMCAEGAVDCDDTADCPPDATSCGPDTIIEAVYCEPGQTIMDCFPEGVPAGYDCVTLESFPIQVECFVPDDGDGDPCTQAEPNVRCLPPDCAVSSDGTINCEKPEPLPCESTAEGCSTEPGCPPDMPDACRPQEGAGSNGSAGEDSAPAEVLPAPAR